MKKYVINFIAIISIIFTSNNFASAQKIVCEVVENSWIIRVFLNLYNDDNMKIECIWVKELDPDKINDNQFEALNLINGIEVSDQDKWYNQLIEYINQLNNLDHSSLSHAERDQQIIRLNTEIFTVLGRKFCENRYGL